MEENLQNVSGRYIFGHFDHNFWMPWPTQKPFILAGKNICVHILQKSTKISTIRKFIDILLLLSWNVQNVPISRKSGHFD